MSNWYKIKRVISSVQTDINNLNHISMRQYFICNDQGEGGPFDVEN